MTLNFRKWFFFKGENLPFTIMDRYIMGELVGPFFFGLAAFTIIYVSCGLFNQVSKLLIKGDASSGTILLFILYSLPQVLVYTCAMSILLGTLLGIGRLSGDCEIIALKAAGVSLYRITYPVLFLALIVTSTSAFLNEFVVPRANFASRKIILETFAREAIPEMQSNLLLRENEGGTDRIIYAKRYDLKMGVMEAVVVSEFKEDIPLRTTHADKAVWETDAWNLIDGKTYTYDMNGDMDSIISFKKVKKSLTRSPFDIALSEKWPEEMTRGEMLQRIAEIKRCNGDYKWLEVEYNLRYAFPFSCIIFAILAVPFAIRPQRSSTSVGFGISLLVIFAYYTVMMASTTGGNMGKIPPVLAAWLPNILFMVVDFFLIRKASR